MKKILLILLIGLNLVAGYCQVASIGGSHIIIAYGKGESVIPIYSIYLRSNDSTSSFNTDVKVIGSPYMSQCNISESDYLKVKKVLLENK